MKQITGFITICIILCVLFSFKGNASDLDFAKVDSLVFLSDVLGAVVECERMSYFAQTPEEKFLACKKQLDVYKNAGMYSEASLAASTFPVMFLLPDDKQFELRFQGALCSYLAGNFDDSRLQLAFLDAGNYDSMFHKKTFLLRAFLAIEKSDFEDSKFWITKEVMESDLSAQQKDSLMNELNFLFSRKGLPKQKSEKMAFWLGFLPGLGHFYAGEYGEGMTAFLLNSVTVMSGIYMVYTKYYLTGYFISTGILVKLYYGSRDRMEYLVGQRNLKEKAVFKNEIGILLKCTNP